MNHVVIEGRRHSGNRLPLRAAKLLSGAALGLLTPVAFAATVQGQAPISGSSTCSHVDIAPAVRITLGKSTIVRPASPIARILMGNPDNSKAVRPTEAPAGTGAAAAPAPAAAAVNTRPGVADVDLLLFSPNEIYLLGKSLGSTNVILLDRRGNCTAFDVVVTLDTAALKSVLDDLMPHEKDIKITSAHESIVLTGTLSDSESLARVTELANAFVSGTQTNGRISGNPKVINMLSVGAPQQVMLEVKVAEVSKNLLDQFGIDFSRAFINGDGTAIRALTGILGGGPASYAKLAGLGPRNVGLSSVGAVLGGNLAAIPGVAAGNVTQTVDATTGQITNTTTFGTVPARSVTNVTANMQKTDGLVKILAEPSVMAISGQTGSFLAGGKIYIPVSQSNANGGRDVTLEEKEFGVSVKFTPTVLGNGRINLHVRPEVSELNAAGITISGVNGNSVLPSFTSRKAETTVQLADGQSFAIGGLVKNNSTSNVKAFPFLGEIPLLGALFRSTEFQTDRSELVFVITPRLVKPLPLDFRLPTDNYVPPTRADLILRGMTEGRLEDGAAPAPATTPAPNRAPPTGGFDTAPASEKKP